MERLEQLFAEAIELPASERMGFLERACAGDPDLLQRLEGMVETHARAERLAFLNPKAPTPAVQPPAPVALGTTIVEGLTEDIGAVIGRYKLLQKIGEGGCGIVDMAEQQEPVRRRVALKIIKLGMDTKQVVARFEAERQALAMMEHPNIAKVLDAGTTETGRPFFVME